MTLQERLEQENKETSTTPSSLGDINDLSIFDKHPGEIVNLTDLLKPGNCNGKTSLLEQ